MIPTGGQDYFIGVVHAHALVIIWMNLDVERSELEDDGRCLGRDKPRGRLRENDLDETNQGQEMKGD